MKSKRRGNRVGVDAIVIPRLTWTCENVFCASREICSNWTNCMDCPERSLFIDFTMADKKPSSTKWGKELIDVFKG